jgi:hypothetical protein
VLLDYRVVSNIEGFLGYPLPRVYVALMMKACVGSGQPLSGYRWVVAARAFGTRLPLRKG